MPETLSEAGIAAAAQLLGCDVPAIKAVAEVESRGQGFLPNGKLKILFEGHIFFKYTRGAYAAQHPTICYPRWTRQFYLGGAREWNRLDEALALDHDAALMSASFGKFQIMGFNFAHCGFTSVDAFVTALEAGEDAHLQAFCAYVKDVGLARNLTLHRWADFAQGYNGPEYQKNQYDLKLQKAYIKYADGG